MLTHSFTPHAERAALLEAIAEFHVHWSQKHTMDAFFHLADAIGRAEEVIHELRACQPDQHSDLTLAVVNLQILIGAAQKAMADVQHETLEESGHRMATEKSHRSPEPAVVVGTILSCPQCEEGLYKVIARTSVDEIVLDDGAILQPLNTTIPKRDAWRGLACPKCGGRYHRDGKLHTLQGGWV